MAHQDAYETGWLKGASDRETERLMLSLRATHLVSFGVFELVHAMPWKGVPWEAHLPDYMPPVLRG